MGKQRSSRGHNDDDAEVVDRMAKLELLRQMEDTEALREWNRVRDRVIHSNMADAGVADAMLRISSPPFQNPRLFL